MAKYESPRYPALGFYVDGVFRRFSGGQYSTDDPAEIDVLDALIDVRRIDEDEPEKQPEQEPEGPKKDAEPADEPVKPAPKTRAKSAANASGK
ncbi:hypothetical protein DFP94_101542 [Fontibacillus phaseoli]|uniref:Uncharacterized protein n=1 Tax=Fontibacillus phaseoli TaxID=1416533 RepID=A0A369BN27_9BACL|nr:hypothetical protein [Fontibacillus phaseoli]RCX22953.1 hypothetical protein DFP94_101542 [Fontibacillus phaseoli]